MKHYYRSRRTGRRGTHELNITAFMNLMVILVPFLLITAVFSRITILDLNLPSSSSSDKKPIKEQQLQVTIRDQSIEVGSSAGVVRLEKRNGEYNLKGLANIMKQIKAQFPEKTDISILSEANTEYDILIQVMDKVRMGEVIQGGEVIKVELFPNISIGDAPMFAAKEQVVEP